MRKNNNLNRASRLGITAAALTAATLLGAGASPAQAVPDKLCWPGATPSISIDNGSGYEVAGSGQVRVRLSKTACWTVTVHFHTSDISATTDVDYAKAVGTLVFSPGTTVKDIPITLFPDNEDEQPDETFAVNLNSPTGATIADKLGIMTILEGDIQPG